MVVLNHYGCNIVFGHRVYLNGKSVALFLTLPANQMLALTLRSSHLGFSSVRTETERTSDGQNMSFFNHKTQSRATKHVHDTERCVSMLCWPLVVKKLVTERLFYVGSK